jgi:hypothetical protein
MRSTKNLVSAASVSARWHTVANFQVLLRLPGKRLEKQKLFIPTNNYGTGPLLKLRNKETGSRKARGQE